MKQSIIDHKSEYVNCVKAISEMIDDAYLAGIKEGKNLNPPNIDTVSCMLNNISVKDKLIEQCERLAFVVADAAITNKINK